MAITISAIGSNFKGYIIRNGADCILIDCPIDADPEVIREVAPQCILHTHVQSEHCSEWRLAPDVPVMVPKGSEELAQITDKYLSDANTRWAQDRDWSALGEETYGIAGCVTARPPGAPLNVVGLLEANTTVTFGSICLDVVSLPGPSKWSMGFYVRDEGILFSGDLLCRGGYLSNLYDLERSYGGTGGYDELLESLNKVLDLAPKMLMPAQGGVVSHPLSDVTTLIDKVTNYLKRTTIRKDRPEAQVNIPPLRVLSHYREMLPGLFQANLAGNTVVLIDESGEGLVIDPGPCLWGSWDDDCKGFRDGLRELEMVAGLKRVTAVLATHSHGDHIQMAEVLRAMYGAPIIAPNDMAALMESPRVYGYPCVLDWYDFPLKSLFVDRIINYDEVFTWAKHQIEVMRTPGHCWVHAGYKLEWQGKVVLFTGDALMYGDGPFQVPTPIFYNDAAWPSNGFGATLTVVEQTMPDVLVGGHGYFCMVDSCLVNDLKKAYGATLVHMESLVGAEHLHAATTPPGYDEKRDRLIRHGSISQT